MRLAFAPALLLAALLVTLAFAPSARAQGVPTVTGITDFLVTAMDADGNGRYEDLVATFNTTVTVPGNFRFQATLTSLYYNYTMYVQNNTDVNLAVGTHAISASISGPEIYLSRTDGPYAFSVTPAGIADNGQAQYYGYLTVSTTTPAYRAADFEPPGASLGAPITDEGLDTDGDGLYNYLVVHVPVVVTRRVSVLVQGCLGCSGGYYFYYNSLPTEFLDLTPGPHTLDLRWDGMLLRMSPPISGRLPITLSLSLSGTAPTVPLLVNQTTYLTQTAYTSAEFETPSVSIPTTPTYSLEDTNGNGKADFLVMHVPLAVRAAGRYIVQVQAAGTGTGPTSAVGGTFASLSPGNQTVDVRLSGIALSRFTTNFLQGAAFALRENPSSPGDVASMSWNLLGFSPSDFESPPVSTLTLNLPGGNQTCAIVYAYDPTNRFLAFTYPSYPYSQQVRIDLYDSTFDLFVLNCVASLGGMVEKITLHGSTSLDVTYSSAARATVRLAYSVPAWNETDLTTTQDLGPGTLPHRLIADYFGNADGFADDAELRNLVAFTGGFVYYSTYYSPVRADNRYLPLVSARLVSISGAGDVASLDPVHVSSRSVYRTANLPVPGDHHRLVIETPYSSPGYAKYEVTLNLAASFGGNLSVGSRMVVFDGDGFTWPGKATVSRTGPRSWSIAVGDTPPDQPAGVQLELTADAYGTPPPPGPTDLVGYIVNPFSVSLILVAAGAVVMYLASRRRRAPRPPT